MAHVHPTESSRSGDRTLVTRSAWKAMFLVLLAVAMFFLITEHRAHLLGAGPYLLAITAALFCMLGHGHGGHGRHRHGGER